MRSKATVAECPRRSRAVSDAPDCQAAIAAIHELPRLLITWCRPRYGAWQ
jgi:hypothetical protein